MNVRELIEALKDADPEAVVLPGTGRMSGVVAAFSSVRFSAAIVKNAKADVSSVKVKYLEMPGTGPVKTVVLE